MSGEDAGDTLHPEEAGCMPEGFPEEEKNSEL